jgi:hypothetical protein
MTSRTLALARALFSATLGALVAGSLIGVALGATKVPARAVSLAASCPRA